MTDLLTIGKQTLVALPFSQLLGAKLAEFSAERVELVILITEQVKQQNDFVYGGVISCAADALTFAGGATLGVAVVTSEYKINYLKPAVGIRLVSRASVIHAGKNQAVCRCDVFAVGEDNKERLCAAAQGTIARLNQTPENL